MSREDFERLCEEAFIARTGDYVDKGVSWAAERIQQLKKWRQNDCRIIDAQRQRIQQLEAGINRAGAYLSQGEPNIARETLAALLKENDK